jgi:hypothetical protein
MFNNFTTIILGIRLYMKHDMETVLISGKERSKFDREVLQAVGASDAIPVSGDSPIWFGIKNEKGEMYRTIGVKDVVIFTEAVKRLRQLQWWVEILEPEGADDLHAIAKKNLAPQEGA